MPRCDCSQNKLPTNATVKVNLIKLSIAGRRGFVKADIVILLLRAACPGGEAISMSTRIASFDLLFLARAFLLFHHDIELQLLLADDLLDAASVIFFVSGGEPFLEFGDFI